MSDICNCKAVELQDNGIVRDKDGVIIGRMNRAIERDEIVSAVAQAWCSSENCCKPMDTNLSNQIVSNVWNLF